MRARGREPGDDPAREASRWWRTPTRIRWSAAVFRYDAGMGRNFAGRVIPSGEELALVVKEPIGVWGCVVPWNYPLLLLRLEACPGARPRGTRWWPSRRSSTPLSTLMLAPCFDHLPAGAWSTLWPARVTWARRSCATRAWRAWASRGRWPPASGWVPSAASTVARMNLEMGGKDPFIVCADVAAERGGGGPRRRLGGISERGPGVHFGRALLRGARNVEATFVEAFVEEARGLRVGDPILRYTDVGPMVSADQRAKVEAQVESAVAARGGAIVGSGRAGQEHGRFYAPAVQ